MVWLSTPTCTPDLPRRRLRPALLRKMRLNLRWLPSMAKLENFDNILQFFAKIYMWSIQRCFYRSLRNWSSLWAAPMAMLRLRRRPKSAPENHAERQVNTHVLAQFSRHVLHTD